MPKVLIVEDDLHTRRMLTLVLTRDRMLRLRRFEVLAAADGREGLTLFQEHRPDLLITDLLMPVMDGFALIEAVRRLPYGKKTPILVTSAVIRNAEVLRRLQLDFDVALQLKPFNPRVLADRVRELLRDASAEAEAPPVMRPARPAPSPPPASARKRARKSTSTASAQEPPRVGGSSKPPTAASPKTPPPAESAKKPPTDAAEHPSPPASAKKMVPASVSKTTAASARQTLGTPVKKTPPADTVPRALSERGTPAVVATELLSGVIDETHTLPALLIRCALEQRSGSLDVQRDKQRKVIHLLGGHPIFVQSNLRSETLGRLLVEHGALSDGQHQKALALAQAERIKYGEALVRLGLLTESEVLSELVKQTRFKVQSCLRWEDANWTFTPDTDVAKRVPTCTIDPVETVLAGLRDTDPHQVLAKLFKRGSTRRFVLSAPPEIEARLGEVLGDKTLEALRARPSLAEVLLRDPDAAVAADALLTCELAHLDDAPAKKGSAKLTADAHRAVTQGAPALDSLVRSRRLTAAADGATGRGGSAWASVSGEDVARREKDRMARALVEAAYLGLHEKSHYDVLGVIPATDENGIEVAYSIKRGQFDLARFRDRDIGEAYPHLEELCEALDEAYRVLSVAELRRAYDATLKKGPQVRSSAMAAEELFGQGMDLLSAGAAEEAVIRFEQAIALDDQPEYRAQEALAYFMAEGQAADAGVEAMVRVQAALAEDPEHPGAHVVAARISRTLGATEEALEHLRAALRFDALRQEAFDELETLLIEEGRLEELEAEYRRVIFRVGSRDRAWSALLWKRLVLLYRDRLHDEQRAHKACDAAFRLNPTDNDLRAALQQLVAAGSAESWPQAVLGYRALLRNNPRETSPLLELFRLHDAAHRADAALVVAGAALWRGVDEPRIRELAERHGRGALKVANGVFTPDVWQLIRDPTDDPVLDGLAATLAPVIDEFAPLTAEDFGLGDETAGLQSLSPDFSSVLRYVSEKLGMPPPRVMVRPELGTDVQATGTTPPLLLVGSDALAINGRRELAFRLGRALTMLTPARRLAAWRSSEFLHDYISAALGLVVPQDVLGQGDNVQEVTQAIMDRPEILEGCQQWVLALHDRGGNFDVAAWQQGTQRTAERVGLLLCTDLRVAGRIVSEVAPEAGVALLDFALGETYARLRERFGLAS